MAIVENWTLNAALEIWNKQDRGFTVADAQAIIIAHCPFKPDVAYKEIRAEDFEAGADDMRDAIFGDGYGDR